jgi:hypothetical protein
MIRSAQTFDIQLIEPTGKSQLKILKDDMKNAYKRSQEETARLSKTDYYTGTALIIIGSCVIVFLLAVNFIKKYRDRNKMAFLV